MTADVARNRNIFKKEVAVWEFKIMEEEGWGEEEVSSTTWTTDFCPTKDRLTQPRPGPGTRSHALPWHPPKGT